MRDWWKVARWEIKRSIKDKTFLVISLLIPLLILAGGILPTLLAEKGASSRLKIAIIDQTGRTETILEERLENTRFEVVKRLEVEKSGRPLEEAKEEIEKDKIDLLLHLPVDFYSSGKAYLYFKNLDTLENGMLKNILNDLVIDNRLKNAGLEPEMVKRLMQPVNLSEIHLSKNGPVSFFGMFLPLILAGMMIFASIFSGSMLMQSIIKEKNDRVVEIVVSSISAGDLIAGKVLGYGILGLLQIVFWAGVGSIVAGRFLDFSLAPLVNGKTILLLIYFLLGYFLTAGMYSLLGASIRDPQTGSQSMGIVTIIPVIPIWTITLIMKNPHGLVPKIMSYFPLTAPNTMLLRLGIASLPTWEILLTIIILIVFDFLLVRFAAKIFRVGILMYGKNPTPGEIIRWAKLKI